MAKRKPKRSPAQIKSAKENLRPFSKGDVRINRDGRPKGFDAWRKLNQNILHELAVDKNGNLIEIEVIGLTKGGEKVVTRHYATNAEMMIRKQLRSLKYNQSVADAAFGKVPNKTEIEAKVEHKITWAEFVEMGSKDDSDNE